LVEDGKLASDPAIREARQLTFESDIDVH
jgi:hypothetical protein